MTAISGLDILVRVTGMYPPFKRLTGRGLTAVAAAIVGCALVHAARGEELQQARVTQVVNDVKLLPNQAAPRPAAINDEVNHETGVRTGSESRTELTFKDL